MPVIELSGVNLGLREGLVVLIAGGVAYILFVLLRMRRLVRPSVHPEALSPRPESSQAEVGAPLGEMTPEPDEIENWEASPPGLASQVLQEGLERELAQLRDEVDAIRGELAALRQDMQQELGHLRAAQTVSPIYGDAMQLAAAGYDAAVIAERCGVARAEAELVVALAKSQER